MQQYIAELKMLYAEACKIKDYRLAFDLLEAGRKVDVDLGNYKDEPDRIEEYKGDKIE